MYEKKIIVLNNGKTCYEFERIVAKGFKSPTKDLYAFNLYSYSYGDYKYRYLEDIKYFVSISELNNYFNSRISEFKKKGFK